MTPHFNSLISTPVLPSLYPNLHPLTSFFTYFHPSPTSTCLYLLNSIPSPPPLTSSTCHSICYLHLKVRKTMADQFYLSLLTFDDLVEADSADSVLMIVSDTVWYVHAYNVCVLTWYAHACMQVCVLIRYAHACRCVCTHKVCTCMQGMHMHTVCVCLYVCT